MNWKPKYDVSDIKELMLDQTPRTEIARITGLSLAEISHLAKAWDIKPYGKLGRPKKVEGEV